MEITKGENANLAGMEPPEGKARNFDDPETIVDHIVGMVADDGSITDVARELAVDYVRTRLLYAGLERLAYIVEEKLTEPAGMEPRCPKCENLNFSVAMVGRDNQIGTCGKCDCNLPVAQFFRSPAPTPPNLYQIFKHKDGCTWLTELPTGVGTWGCSCGLDKLLLELEDYELTAPTPPLDVEARELEEAWSMLVERGVRIYTLSTALIDRDAYARTERAITQLLSLLRRHITSPAQPEKRDEVKACEVCDETEMLTVMGRNQYACPKHRAVAPQSGKEGQ